MSQSGPHKDQYRRAMRICLRCERAVSHNPFHTHLVLTAFTFRTRAAEHEAHEEGTNSLRDGERTVVRAPNKCAFLHSVWQTHAFLFKHDGDTAFIFRARLKTCVSFECDGRNCAFVMQRHKETAFVLARGGDTAFDFRARRGNGASFQVRRRACVVHTARTKAKTKNVDLN